MKIGPALPGAAAPEPRSIAEASKQFEGLLMSELFKVMRRSIPKSAMSSGLSNDVFTGMLDEQLARNIAESGGLGLGEMIARQMESSTSTPTADLPSEISARLTDGTWVRPTPHQRLRFSAAQQFGAPRGGRGHRGLDIGGRTGTPVLACGAGEVVSINHDTTTTGGLSVAIAHPGGLSTSYAHLDSIRPDLRVGASIAAGDAIGALGATGTGAKGSHLHFAVRAQIDGKTVHLDPEPHVGAWPTADDKR